ncbi:hypothetical protein [Polyangium mundeleinium]|uniref:Sigma-70 family RNA polymerase sigma factor n=1 Tax=Polyangium mundeleinium TaxID=2995306 RepID=A0ABT5EGS3_9BACT|nr:hypothetical protein [Polyangium mundeleinium]MDC0740961.1 hypothetical protein [Polyangium mundeleinium]
MTNDAIDELRAMTESQYEELAAALSLHAKRVANRKRWAGSNPLGTASGSEDFVYGVVEKVISGVRPWSRASNHSLRQHLFECIRSEVDNLSKLKENVAREEFDGQPIADTFVPTPEQLLEQKQWAQHVERLLYEVASDDPLLRQIVDLWLEGFDKPADMAEHLGLPVDRINVGLRKIDRRLHAENTRSKIEATT